MIQDVAAAATSLPEHCRSRFGFLRAAWLALALLGLIASRPAHADTQIQSAAGTCVSATGTGTIAWSNPSRAQTSDNSYATAALTGNNVASNFLKCTSFGFSIPSTALIQGIRVEWEYAFTTGGTIKDNAVRVVKGGTIGATDTNLASAVS